MNLQTKQFEVLQDFVQRERKGITYEEIKNYVKELASNLEQSHDCKLSIEDGCDACRAITQAEDAVLTNLVWLERTNEAVDELTEQEMVMNQLAAGK